MTRTVLARILATSLILLAVAGPAGATTNPLNPLVRTDTVPAGAGPIANGALLLATVASLSPPPDPEERWNIRLDAGIFDLGGATLKIPSYVTLEGAGRAATCIISKVSAKGNRDSATVLIPQDTTQAEIMELTIINSAPSTGTALTIHGSPDFRLTRVDLRVEPHTIGTRTGVDMIGSSALLNEVSVTIHGRGATYGVLIDGGQPRITDLTVDVIADDLADAFGVWVRQSASALIDRADVSSYSRLFGTGIEVWKAHADITNSKVTVTGERSSNGILISTATAPAKVRDTIIDVSGSGAQGQVITASDVLVENANIRAIGTSYGDGVITTATTSRVHHSTVEGSSHSFQNYAGGVSHIGSSQLIGPVGTGTFVCAGAWDASYTPLPGTC